MLYWLVAMIALLCGCAAHRSSDISCRIVKFKPSGQIIKHGADHPAPWHTGLPECKLRLLLIEAAGSPEIGVEFRGSESKVAELQRWWRAQHETLSRPELRQN